MKINSLSNKEEQELLNNSDKETYSQNRDKLKFTTLETSIILFEATVGIGLFTLHYPLKDSGVIWGLILSILLYFLTTYGLTLYDKISIILEKENQEKRIRTLEDLVKEIKGGKSRIVWGF